jgi:hypothetical protein
MKICAGIKDVFSLDLCGELSIGEWTCNGHESIPNCLEHFERVADILVEEGVWEWHPWGDRQPDEMCTCPIFDLHWRGCPRMRGEKSCWKQS